MLTGADSLSLKVFPPNQRTQGVFNEQDLRLKSLMKDMDCSDLAVREAWESFVSVSWESQPDGGTYGASDAVYGLCAVGVAEVKVPHVVCGHCRRAVRTANLLIRREIGQ